MIAPDTLLQDRYRVVKQIGQGGMGAVYLATDERFSSTVAVKQTFFDDPAMRKAFEREAHLLNYLRHAALPKVSDHFSEGEGQFLVMEFIPGYDLAELLQQHGGAFPLADVLQWGDELLDALDYLHTQNPVVIHRDIKPQNLKRTPRGQIVLLDFGLAKGTSAQTRASVTASVFGYSRNYAPLEQIQGAGTDARSDLYSLGATLYHLLTGTPPVDALARASAIINNQPDPLRPANLMHAQIPAAIGEVLHRAMAQNAALRPSTAAEMRAALREAANAVADTAASRASASTGVSTPGQTAFDGTILFNPPTAPSNQKFTQPPNGQQPNSAARSTLQQRPSSATQNSELTIVDAPHSIPRRPARTSAAPPAHTLPASPAPRSQSKLVGIAVVVLLVACAAVAFMLTQSSDAQPATQSGLQTGTPPGTITDPQLATPDAQQTAATGGNTPNTLSATDGAPLTSQAPNARTTSEATMPASTASSAPGNAETTNANGLDSNGKDAAGNEANRALTPNGASSDRSGLVLHMPAPSPQPADNNSSAASEEAARRDEEFRRRQMRPPPHEEERYPPPGGRHRPPPRRPPPFR